MRKKLLFALLGISIATGAVIRIDDVHVPKFRTAQDKVSDESINTIGLDKLRVSGSHLSRFDSLAEKLKNVDGPIYIVDPISTVHGYINGRPETDFGFGEQSHQNWKKTLKHGFRRLVYLGTLDYKKDDKWQSEEEVVKSYGYNYIQLSVDIDGKKRFRLDELMRFVEIAESLPKNAWVHVHCAHGCSRTTLVMCALDMLANAPEVSVEDIVKRQKALGGVDLFDVTAYPGGTYTAEDLQARKQLVIDLYHQIVERKRQQAAKREM